MSHLSQVQEEEGHPWAVVAASSLLEAQAGHGEALGAASLRVEGCREAASGGP